MSDGPYLCYKELSPDLAVEGGTFFQSYNPCTDCKEDYLCTITVATINVYKVHESDFDKRKVFSLELLKFLKIFGKLRDIQRLKKSTHENDLLVVAIDLGKIVCLEYDMMLNDILQFPLYNLEENAIGLGSDVTVETNGRQTQTGSELIVRVNDSQGMISAALYGEYIFFAVVSTSQETNLLRPKSFSSERMLQHIHQQLHLAGPILDIVFVHGYSNPVLAVLHQQHYLPIGHAKKVLHTCAITVFTVDIDNQFMAILWSKNNLPHDSLHLIEIKSHSMNGWVTCISQNAVVTMNESSLHAFAVNSFASITVHSKIKLHVWNESKVGLELDGSHWAPYGDDSNRECSIIGVLRNGSVVLVRILFVLFDVAETLRFDCIIIGESSPASCMIIEAKSHLLFVGSRVGDSNLYEMLYRRNEAVLYHDQLEYARKWLLNQNEAKLTAIEPHQKVGETDERMKHILGDYNDDDDNVLEDFAVAEEIANEERDFYGCTAVESDPSFQVPREHDWIVNLTVQDSVFNFGPILHGTFTKNEDTFSHLGNLEWDRTNVGNNIRTNQPAASYITDRDCRDSLLIASGVNNDGRLHRIIQGVGFSKVGNRNFLGATRLFTLGLKGNHSLVLVSYENKTRILDCQLEVPLSNVTLQTLPEIKFQEYGEDSGLITTSSTIFLGQISSKDRKSTESQNEENGFANESDVVVQVIPLGVRVMRLPDSNIFGSENAPLQDMLLLDEVEIGGLGGKIGENILSADCCPEYLSVLTNFHRLLILKFNYRDQVLELLFVKQAENGKVESLLSWITSEIVSVSLYYGSLILVTSSMGNNIKETISRSLSAVEKEELFFYGCLISDMNEDGSSKVKSAELPFRKESTFEKVSSSSACSNTEEAFMLICDEEGFFSVCRLSDLTCVLRTSSMSMQESRVNNEVDQTHYMIRNQAPPKLQSRYIIEARLVNLNYKINDSYCACLSKLCLFLLFHTGELVVYHALQRNQQIYGWYKVMSQIIHNKRFLQGKLLRGQSDGVLFMRNNSFEGQNPSSTSEYIANYLETEDYLHRTAQTLHKISHFHHYHQDAVLISSNDPKIYFLEKGCSILMPVGFPETPYVNYGQCLLLPLPSLIEQSNWSKADHETQSIACCSLIATLWYEFEDIDVFKNPGNIKHRAQRQATFGLYRLLPNQHFSCYDSISVQSIETKQTIHKIYELAKLTDNTTEQALLEKKTYLLYSSKDQYQEFQPDLHAALQENSEDVMYERYFPILDSFANPDPSVAPHPLTKSKEFRISLLQSGRIVDSFLVSDKELVVDVTPLYLTVEKMVTQTIGMSTSTIKVYEKRVFILVSVLTKDARGEDSQGNGKLLLLGIDYAMFEDDIRERIHHEGGEHIDGQPEAHIGTENGDLFVENSRSLPRSKESSKYDANKAQQQFLGAIRPKLKLLWSGPGPASVIYQMPSFPSNITHNNPNHLNHNNSNGANPTTWSTSLDSMNSSQMFSNYIIATVGATLYIYKLNSNTMELDQITFYFSQFYITSVTSVKNYIVMTDMYHSVSLLYFREEDLSLHLVSKDFDDRVLCRSEVMVDGNKIGIITSDDRSNLQCFQQNRRKLDSLTGTKLLCLSEFHLASEVSCMISHDLLLPEYQIKKLTASSAGTGLLSTSMLPPSNSNVIGTGNLVPPPPPPPPRTRKGSTFPLQIFGTRLTKISNFPLHNPVNHLNFPHHRRTSIVLGSMDGLLGVLLPLEERMYKRLLLLQQILSMILPVCLSLNAVEFRYHFSAFRLKYPSFLTFLSDNSLNSVNKRRVLDSNILSRFLSLDCFIQDEIAQLIGVHSYILRENLHEIDYVMRYF